MSTFDPHLETPGGGPVLFKGEFTHIRCVDPAATFPALSQENLVMNGSQPFNIELKWELSGSLVPLWLSALGGSWSVEGFAESVGPGPEIQIAANSVPVNASQSVYSTTMIVPANTLPEGNPGPGGPSGKYKIICSCFLNSSLGPPGYDISGFVEGPVIRIENPI